MREKAILYTRVSTDEQNSGYSPADQKDKLYKYCELNNIEVVGFYHEDESAKDFNRPEWKKIIQYIKKNKTGVDSIYFVKWDRFSRDTPQGYIAIEQLRKLGVYPHAIEQPLDLDIPESQIMLAVYLAAPHVDNLRRALNIFNGIRRGKKEGRWLGSCLRGYKNTRDERNKPIIVPEGGNQQALVKMAFTEFATGVYGIEELRQKLYKKGLKCERNAFWKLLRNKGYIGKILVPAYKDEKAEWVEGQHEPLIDEIIFYKVQDILSGRRKNIPKAFTTVRNEFPLRGFLLCPRCNNLLTGSFSTGKMGTKFPYYHCTKGCKERQKSENIHSQFTELLHTITVKPGVIKLFSTIIKGKLKAQATIGKAETDAINSKIMKLNQRIKNIRSNMLDGHCPYEEYKEFKIEIEEEISNLEQESKILNNDSQNLTKKINECTELLLNLDKYYERSDTVTKQHIVSSIFPEKLIFDNNAVRTLVLNKVLSLICNIGKGFEGDKKEKHTSFGVLSHRVDPERTIVTLGNIGIIES